MYILTVGKTWDISLLNVSIANGFQPLLHITDTNLSCNGNNIHFMSHTLYITERKSVSLLLFFFHTAISTWHYLPGKMTKGQNTGCRTTLLKAPSHQQASAYVWVTWEWCSSISQTDTFYAEAADASWVQLELGPFGQHPHGRALQQTHLPCAPLPATTNRRCFGKVVSDKRWHVPHSLRQVSAVEVCGITRKARLTS